MDIRGTIPNCFQEGGLKEVDQVRSVDFGIERILIDKSGLGIVESRSKIKRVLPRGESFEILVLAGE